MFRYWTLLNPLIRWFGFRIFWMSSGLGEKKIYLAWPCNPFQAWPSSKFCWTLYHRPPIYKEGDPA